MSSSPGRNRLWLAFLVAPIVAPAAFIVAVLGVQVVRSGAPSLRSGMDLVTVVFAVGTPLAYLATVALGAPLYFILRALGVLRHWTVLVGGAAIGVVVAVSLSPHLGGDLFSVKFPWWAGALLGLVSAEVFWRVQRVQPSGGRDA